MKKNVFLKRSSKSYQSRDQTQNQGFYKTNKHVSVWVIEPEEVCGR